MVKNGEVRNTDPSTSVEAAEGIDATRLENIAYFVLKKDGGWRSYFEWAQLAGLELSSTTPRGRPLWLKGRVKRETRPGQNARGKIRNLLHFKAI
jgi:hypothetical protein